MGLGPQLGARGPGPRAPGLGAGARGPGHVAWGPGPGPGARGPRPGACEMSLDFVTTLGLFVSDKKNNNVNVSLSYIMEDSRYTAKYIFPVLTTVDSRAFAPLFVGQLGLPAARRQQRTHPPARPLNQCIGVSYGPCAVMGPEPL